MADYISKIQLPGGTSYNFKASAFPSGVTSGDGSAYTVTVSPEVSLIDGTIIVVKFNATNSATTPTLNVNSLGAKRISHYLPNDEDYGDGIPLSAINPNLSYALVYSSSALSNAGGWIMDVNGELLKLKIEDASYVVSSHIVEIRESLSDKIDKVSQATSGNFAAFDSNGNIVDSTKSSSSFAEIDDTTSSSSNTWSASKISTELSGKQGTLTQGLNIVINGNTISAVIDAGFDVEVVESFSNLPSPGVANTIYFVPITGGTNPNVYDEYMYINNAYETIGTTEVDLSNYYNKTEIDTALSGKQAILTAGANVNITSNTIKAVGYRYDTSTGAFAEGDRDINDNGITRVKSTATGIMAHAEGINCTASGKFSHVEGGNGTASGNYSHVEGSGNVTIGAHTHAEGANTKAGVYASHTEGYLTETGGDYTSNTKIAGTQTGAGSYAHAEGNATIAKGVASHSEGLKTFARGNYTHAEGNTTKSLGNQSHSEGLYSESRGVSSHTEGRYTQALNNAEHAQGSYNLSHTDNTTDGFGTNGNRTIHSIGIGTSDNARLNAVEVMLNGDMYIKGIGSYDGVHIKNETGAPAGTATLQEVINGKQDTMSVITTDLIEALINGVDMSARYLITSDPQSTRIYRYSNGDEESYVCFSDVYGNFYYIHGGESEDTANRYVLSVDEIDPYIWIKLGGVFVRSSNTASPGINPSTGSIWYRFED